MGFEKKDVSTWILSTFSKTWWKLSEDFQQVCRNWLLNIHDRNVLKLVQKIFCFWAKSFRCVCRICIFSIQKKILVKKSIGKKWKKNMFRLIPSPAMDEKDTAVLSNCFPHDHRKTRRKSLVLYQAESELYHFLGTSGKPIRVLGNISFRWIVKAAFYVSWKPSWG